ncbi:UDP-N-acetylmuramoyl-L-alanyl-D-glutamate--2,6-diaminopimelate ligase [Patescibacteria group bacterium]|nr:UDP-N-acetylmuramoyl-L-alanyl-D-glutamate--2,6-diaminopimelate ligase [Patescibacteria group bacterium]
MIKAIIKKIIPKQILLFYHWSLAHLAALVYGRPSKKMITIGVTGTSGKSTVANLIAQILEQAGFIVGLATTFNFKIRGKETINKKKMTMLGRFSLQKLLKQMIKADCQYAIIETTSEGIRQYRHLGINYDVGIFTNLAPEHIESHGSFEKYRQTKQKFFQHLSKCKTKKINNKVIKKISIVNLDDENREHFLKFKVDQQYGIKCDANLRMHTNATNKIKIIKAEDIELNSSGSRFKVQGSRFTLNLLGKFNVYNALSAICLALSQGTELSVCQKALTKIEQIPGRMEVVSKQPFTVIVDYAHTPDSLKKVYQTIKKQQPKIPMGRWPRARGSSQQLICVLGSAGGGRDKWKRPILGEIAEKYGDKIIITNEDPYDEDPEQIIDEIISGIKNNQELISQKKLFKILDRKKAIKKALALARQGDIVIITGKGCEPWIMGPKNKRVHWDDREIVKKLLKEK